MKFSLGLNSQEIRKIGGKITVFQFGGERGRKSVLFFFEQNREFLQNRDLRFRELALTFVHKSRSGRFGLLFVTLKNVQDSCKLRALLGGGGSG